MYALVSPLVDPELQQDTSDFLFLQINMDKYGNIDF